MHEDEYEQQNPGPTAIQIGVGAFLVASTALAAIVLGRMLAEKRSSGVAIVEGDATRELLRNDPDLARRVDALMRSDDR